MYSFLKINSMIERLPNLAPGSSPHNPIPVETVTAGAAGDGGRTFVEIPDGEGDKASRIVAVVTDPEDFGTVDARLGRFWRHAMTGAVESVHSVGDQEATQGPFAYPYHATALLEEMRENPSSFIVHKTEGFNLRNRIAGLKKPILELGGPTTRGYFFLEDVALPSKPYITNISAYPPGMHHLATDIQEAVDGTNMPFADASVGMVMMSCMPITSRKLAEADRPSLEDAHAESQAFAAGNISAAELESNERIKIYVEAARVLAEGGLMIVNRPSGFDVAALHKLGLKPVAALERTNIYEESAHRQDLDRIRFESLVLEKPVTGGSGATT